jgi:hypothetical protein
VEFLQGRRSGPSMAVLASLVVHLALLLVLALWVRQASLSDGALLLTVSQGESADSGLLELASFEILPQSEPEAAPEQALVEPQLQIDYAMEPLFGPPSDAGSSIASLLSMNPGDAAATLSSASAKSGAAYFGSYAEGRRFVYVLDSSRSMRGDRWTYACNQLLDSLKSLSPEQEFFIICFDLQTTYLFNRRPDKLEYQVPGETMVAQVQRWLRGRTLGKATMPSEALQAALMMEPDAVFLLSDGELQDNSLWMLRQLNSKRSMYRQIPIHTIHLFSPDGRETLEMIAMENGGTFTHISR